MHSLKLSKWSNSIKSIGESFFFGFFLRNKKNRLFTTCLIAQRKKIHSSSLGHSAKIQTPYIKLGPAHICINYSTMAQLRKRYTSF